MELPRLLNENGDYYSGSSGLSEKALFGEKLGFFSLSKQIKSVLLSSLKTKEKVRNDLYTFPCQ